MNLLYLQNTLLVLTQPTHVAAYDFCFELFFECTHPSYIPQTQTGILRVGALDNYPRIYHEYIDQNIQLVNTPQEHVLASELNHWYPLIQDLTPFSQCFEHFPPVSTIDSDFGWPVFIKGTRQTSRHNPKLCIAHNANEYHAIANAYKNDAILHWQPIAIRRFIPLEPLYGQIANKIAPSVEFRTFWWHNQLAAVGPYWYQLPPYRSADLQQGIQLAQQAANRLNVPFLVIDIAKTCLQQWIIIECNDAQESGYCGIAPQQLWQFVLEHANIPSIPSDPADR